MVIAADDEDRQRGLSTALDGALRAVGAILDAGATVDDLQRRVIDGLAKRVRVPSTAPIGEPGQRVAALVAAIRALSGFEGGGYVHLDSHGNEEALLAELAAAGGFRGRNLHDAGSGGQPRPWWCNSVQVEAGAISIRSQHAVDATDEEVAAERAKCAKCERPPIAADEVAF
jgi:hypothetical protein